MDRTNNGFITRKITIYKIIAKSKEGNLYRFEISKNMDFKDNERLLAFLRKDFKEEWLSEIVEVTSETLPLVMSMDYFVSHAKIGRFNQHGQVKPSKENLKEDGLLKHTCLVERIDNNVQ